MSVPLKMIEMKLIDKNAKFWGAEQYVLYLWTFLPLVPASSVVKSLPVTGKNSCNHNAEVYRASF